MKRIAFLILLFAAISNSAAIPQDGNDCWGSDNPCADGKYRAHDGKVQPHTCDNNYQTADADKCICAKATTKLEQCPDSNMDMKDCLVWCRESHDCKCVSVCDFNDGK